MKHKIFTLILLNCVFCYFAHAQQCYATIAYQTNPNSNVVAFWPSNVTGSSNTTVYTWSFGDGTSATGTQVTHSFNAFLGYAVCLTMSDTANACTFTTCDTINPAGGSTCTTAIAFTRVDSLYHFTASSSGTGPFTYSWDMNVTIVDTGASTDLVIDSLSGINGAAQVCVTVTDSTGCVSSDCVSIPTGNQPLDSCNSYVTYTNIDSIYTFTVSNTGNIPVAYEWYFNGTLVATTNTATLTLGTPALGTTNNVCVYVTSANGSMCSDCVTITNTNPNPCQAYFVIYVDSTNVLNQGYYVGYNFSSGSYGQNVLWDFGDGTTSTNAYPTHTYAQPGNYIVCLTVGQPNTACYDTYCDSSFYVFKTEGGLMSHLSIQAPTGITETKASVFGIYPNPVGNELNFSTASNITLVRIFNTSGQLVMERKNVISKLNVAHLAAGIYFMQYQYNGLIYRLKLLKD